MFIKSCEPPPVYQISTIGRLEICTSASAAKGNVEKAYLQKMLVMHITVYHHLQDGGRNGVGRGPKEPREVFAISESTSLLIAFRGKARQGWGPELYICSFKCIFPLKCSCLPLRGLLCSLSKSARAQRLRGLRIEYSC